MRKKGYRGLWAVEQIGWESDMGELTGAVGDGMSQPSGILVALARNKKTAVAAMDRRNKKNADARAADDYYPREGHGNWPVFCVAPYDPTDYRTDSGHVTWRAAARDAHKANLEEFKPKILWDDDDGTMANHHVYEEEEYYR